MSSICQHDLYYDAQSRRKTHIRKALGLTRHISIATGVDLGARVRAPNTARPIPTERDIENDVQVLEFGVVVTPSAKVCDRSTPSRWVGISTPDVRRYVASGKVPHLDARSCP
jgi:hypothetical protein